MGGVLHLQPGLRRDGAPFRLKRQEQRFRSSTDTRKREHNNQLIACVRTGPSRTREDYDHLTSRIQSAWDSIVNTPSHPSTRLRAIFVMGSILAGREIGFALPQAGEDRAWLEENAAEFSRLAGEGDEEMKELVKDMREANGFGCKGN